MAEFKVIPFKIFLEQIRPLSSKSKRIIEQKIELIRLNPYRFKRVHSKNFSMVFRVRMTLDGKERRLIYVIIKDTVFLVCIFDRDKGYRDLEKFLAKFKNEIK